MVPLNHALTNGQRVEIVAAKQGGPSRDWLNPELGYAHSHRARTKVRQWFKAQQHEETLAQGRAIVERELQRAGATAVKPRRAGGEGGLRARPTSSSSPSGATRSTRGRSDRDPGAWRSRGVAPEPRRPSRKWSRGRARRPARAAASSSSASTG